MKALFQKPPIFFVVVALAILVVVMMVRNKAPVEHQSTGLEPKQVDVIEVVSQKIHPTTTAYGSVEHAVALQNRAEVSGKISYMHPGLKQGGSISAGTLVLRIDPEDVQVSLKQSEADLKSNLSSLQQLDEEEKTSRRSLRLARDNLNVGRNELQRIEDLWNKRLVARSVLDAEKQNLLQLEQNVSDLQGQLNTFVSRRASAQAQIERASQQVRSQQTSLGRTELYMPFDARIGTVPVERGEYVSVGTALFEALTTDRVEITAQLPIQQMAKLVSGAQLSTAKIGEVMQQLGLKARVSLVGGQEQAAWQAEVVRFSEAIDPVRRTLGIVVAVDNPYEKIIPGKRPPLIKGMYTAVDLYAPAIDALVIPRKAIHEGRVYLVGADQKLEIRAVEVLFTQGDFALISEGLSEGDKVIVNDLIPVIQGMPLAPVTDQGYQEELKSASADADLAFSGSAE
ncbi:efflux RND transporter periplasmic adaptor subunit [Amphritea sp. HPY]|uniref:efflux RND transporter periplasmic adaptor subunit n=1 Tax=Amphritea sp. HPY TaxID=3421652 RepID=UPI003D7CD4D0